MFFKYFSLVFMLLLTSFSNLYAGKGDLYIYYDLPEASKQRLYKDFVAGSVPYNKTAQDYHVTLTWVNKVAPQHRNLLKTRLDLVANSYRSNIHFTPNAAVQLGKSLQSTIVLVPQDAEKKYFQKINNALYDEVINFNTQYNTSYDLSPLVLPQNYKPHSTIARTKEDIQKHNLNPQQVMNMVNLKLDNYKNTYGMGFDLFVAAQPKPVAKAPLPQPKSVAKALLPQPKPVAKALLPQPKSVAKALLPQPKPVAKAPLPQPKPVAKAPLPQSKPVAKALLPQPKPVAKAPLPQSKPVAKASSPQSKPIAKVALSQRKATPKKPALRAKPASKRAALKRPVLKVKPTAKRATLKRPVVRIKPATKRAALKRPVRQTRLTHKKIVLKKTAFKK